MKTLTYFFRHPHAIYFSIEKLFHAVAGDMAGSRDRMFFVKELDLPFTSSLKTIRKNIAFTRKNQSEVNHITGDAQYAILGCSRKNINVLTVHDCVLLYHYPKTHPKHWIIKWLWYRLPVKRADVITVISENTKKDLIHFTHCPAARIRVIPNFIDPSFKPVAAEFRSEQQKLLFIGTAANKNFERTIEALEGMPVLLLIVGYLTDQQRGDLESKKIAYRLLNKLSDRAMREVYAEADIMLFPSTYEGFGLPIIEAQATGRPVLTSALEPMTSVAGGAACLVDPFQSVSIREGLLKIISDKKYREELVAKGFKNVERFQLKNISKQYTDLYTELIQRKAG